MALSVANKCRQCESVCACVQCSDNSMWQLLTLSLVDARRHAEKLRSQLSAAIKIHKINYDSIELACTVTSARDACQAHHCLHKEEDSAMCQHHRRYSSLSFSFTLFSCTFLTFNLRCWVVIVLQSAMSSQTDGQKIMAKLVSKL